MIGQVFLFTDDNIPFDYCRVMVHSESNNLSTATPVPNNNAIEVKIGQNTSMLNSMNAPASTIKSMIEEIISVANIMLITFLLES